MNNKKVMFWLHRVLTEKCEDIKAIQERISILNHQIQNFDKMQEEYQNDVIKDLVEDLRCYDWQEAITELEIALQKDSEKPLIKQVEVKSSGVSGSVQKDFAKQGNRVSSVFDGLQINEYLMICDAFKEGMDFKNEKLQGLKNILKQRYSELKRDISFNEASMKARIELFDLMIKSDAVARVGLLLEAKRKELNEDLYKVCHITDKCKICPFNLDGRHCKLFTKLDEVCSQSQEGKE